MRSSCVIGGEFEIDIQRLQKSNIQNVILENVFKYSSGRSALYYILLDVQKRFGIKKVYLPDYICSSILFAVKESGLEIMFYSLNDILEIDIEKFTLKQNERAAILLINYFGIQNLQSQITLVRSISEDVVIIEDDVQAFYEFINPQSNPDYRFTSIRKTFACPDGGLVMTHYELKKVDDINSFHQYKIVGSILKNLRKSEFYGDEVYINLLAEGEKNIDEDITLGMSKISQEIITKTDFEQVANIRGSNTRKVLEGLKRIGVQTILPIPDNKTILFVPIWLKDRDKVRQYMFDKQIYCPVHWPLNGMCLKKGAEMAKHEMSIIIDQRYTNLDMEYILTTLEEALV